jgi:hypothetical protein
VVGVREKCGESYTVRIEVAVKTQSKPDLTTGRETDSAIERG